ncbi:hypothetical protein D9Q98_000239 [Chlorella vulgaris]|uniref:NAD(P)-binding domain-containing protein n=1 Tax=Chlorella vulgaris TaxID=3077 RepID=A0A9D4TY01_CHLVU|nr:hypothetical protein D9Q98_000239 [Chlorella vulgaris]
MLSISQSLCAAPAARCYSHLAPDKSQIALSASRGIMPMSSGGRRRASFAPAAEKKGGSSFGDELLDFMYAGKKLRKWYGAEGQVLPRDGREEAPPPAEPEQDEEPGEREYVAVLDADSSPMAEQVVLQLILKRAKIRALVRDTVAAKDAFGPYLEAVQGSSSDRTAVTRLLRGAKAAVCCAGLGTLLPAAAAAKLPHIVLLSSAGPPKQGFSLFASSEQQALADPAREQQLRSSGLAHTIVQVGGLAGVPGGTSSLSLTAGQQPRGQVSQEDAAKLLAEAAERDAAAGSLVMQLSSSGAGEPPEDWQAALSELPLSSPA